MKYKIIMAALLTVATSSAFANEVLIDFEDNVFLAVPSSGTTSFSYENVTFSGIGRDSAESKFNFKSLSLNLTPDVSGTFLQTGSMNFETLKLSFDTAVSDFSFNFGSFNSNDWELTAFDESGSVIDTLSIDQLTNGANNNGQFFGISSGLTNISYATLSDLSTGFLGLEKTVMIDNFKYTEVSPVPEPSTYALMLGGLGMVGFMAYRRRKQTSA